MAEQADTIGDPALAGELLDRGAFRSFPDDDKINPREADERLDHHAMTLQADEIANGQKSWPGQAERASRRLAIGRSEEREIDPVAQHAHAFLGDPECHQPPLQPSRHCDQSIRPPCRPANPPPRSGILRYNVEIAAAGGDDDRATEGTSEQHCGDAIRIEIMCVDQIEVPPPAELSAQNRQKSGENGERCHAHADLRQLRIARMIYMQSISDLLAWLPGEERVAAEPWRCERKPRTGRHDASPDYAALYQFSQAGFDENPVLGPDLARIQRRKGQDLQLHA